MAPSTDEAARASGPADLTGFRLRQKAFADHLRDPLTHPPPDGIEPRRMGIYRDLFFNNVDGFLRGFFPVLHSLYSEDDWLSLSKGFFAQHRSETPLFLGIAEEFLAFLQARYQPRPGDPPYMRELAHYEWLELALDVAEEEIPIAGIDPDGELLGGVPVINPVSALMRYDWPVHRISAQAPDVLPAETWLLVYRDRGDQVRFQEFNAVAARLFTLARDQDAGPGEQRSARELAERIAAELGHAEPAVVIAGALETFQQWRARDVLLGTASSIDLTSAYR